MKSNVTSFWRFVFNVSPLMLSCFFVLSAYSQSTRIIPNAFRLAAASENQNYPNQHIWATAFQTFQLDYNALNTQLSGADIPNRLENQASTAVFLDIPNPHGGFDRYKVLKNATMHPELENKFPEIRTYDLVGVAGNLNKGKIDITPQGFHAMIFDRENGTYFIDPIEKNRNDLYMVYYKKDFISEKSMSCSHEHEDENSMLDEIIDSGDDIRISYASCVLRTYRLAVAATGEYTAFHGGTVALAQAAQVTTMNRVNGVYEKEIGITMQFIPNNELIIYTNAATDPYTNGTPGTMINQNQTNITNVIGSANYDIGHVFGTNSGGLAGLGVVCSNSNKARGVTGSAAPVGDPFDIDYVAHEIGHQFGANHTQNNPCNSVNAARYEPGSASTIMGYAGICAPNVQNNSDDYFHTRSLQEMGTFVSGNNHTCPQIVNHSNQAPSISSTNGSVSLPISTPFALTATATDPNAGDVLYYRWEQYNNQASTQPPVATSTGGPNFRSFTSTTNPTRYFPNLTALANNGPFTWEVVPSVARTMAFRVTVHDDHTIGGCSDYVNTSVTFDASAGPFVLTYPSASGITWVAGSTQTITWNVANTNNAAVNCQLVDLFLSTDGGATYPILLAEDVPNNGSFNITTPNLPNTTSRVMAMAENGTFFDISNNNFTIINPTNGYQAQVNVPSLFVCQGVDANIEIVVNQIGNYTENVSFTVAGLPQGTPVQWTNNPTPVPGQATLSIETMTLPPNIYNIQITANSAAGPQTLFVSLQISPDLADASFTLIGQQLVANQTFGQHQWLDCKTNPPSPISGATQPELTLTETTGSFALQVTNGNCENTSACLDIDMTSLADFENAGIEIYPNPTNDKIALSWHEQLKINALKLYDASGKLISEVSNLGNTHVFDMSQLSAGLYYMELVGADKVFVSKIVKN
jgi:hypothetical protein